MYRCESCTIKKAEHWRIDTFKLWCWRRLLRVPWTARRSNLSILKEIHLEYSLEGLMLKLKPQHFGPLIWRVGFQKNTLMLGKDWRQEGKRVTKDEMVDGITDSIDMNLSKLWETVKHREAWRAAIHGVSKSQTWLSDWTAVGKRGLLACSWQRPRELLNILQCTGSPPATKNDLVQYINSIKVEKLFPR